MDIKPVQAVSPTKPKFDFDNNEIFDTKTGKTVAEITFKEVLDKILKEGDVIVR